MTDSDDQRQREMARKMSASGVPNKMIAKALGVGDRKVREWLSEPEPDAPTPPDERRSTPRPGASGSAPDAKLDPSAPNAALGAESDEASAARWNGPIVRDENDPEDDSGVPKSDDDQDPFEDPEHERQKPASIAERVGALEAWSGDVNEELDETREYKREHAALHAKELEARQRASLAPDSAAARASEEDDGADAVSPSDFRAMRSVLSLPGLVGERSEPSSQSEPISEPTATVQGPNLPNAPGFADLEVIKQGLSKQLEALRLDQASARSDLEVEAQARARAVEQLATAKGELEQKVGRLVTKTEDLQSGLVQERLDLATFGRALQAVRMTAERLPIEDPGLKKWADDVAVAIGQLAKNQEASDKQPHLTQENVVSLIELNFKVRRRRG